MLYNIGEIKLARKVFDANEIHKTLDLLKNLPNITEARSLRNRLNSELKKFKKEKVVVTVSKEEIQNKANKKRSGKLRSYHSFMRQIKKQRPDLSYLQVRQEHTKRKQGFESYIPDVIWQNPSP